MAHDGPRLVVQGLGIGSLFLGLGGMAAVGVAAAIGHETSGAVPGSCLVLLMVGLALAKPELIQDDAQQTSTMRVVVLGIVTLFMLVTTKAAWSASDLQHLILDRSWAWVLGAALGGKALQSFSESRWPSRPRSAIAMSSSSGSTSARNAQEQPNDGTQAIQRTNGPKNRPKV